FLGLGTPPDVPSWGNMLKEAQGFMTLSPYPALVPGLAIVWTVLGFSLLGDALRDLWDPRACARRRASSAAQPDAGSCRPRHGARPVADRAARRRPEPPGARHRRPRNALSDARTATGPQPRRPQDGSPSGEPP